MDDKALRRALLRGISPAWLAGTLALPAYYAVLKFGVEHYHVGKSVTLPAPILAVMFFVYKQMSVRGRKRLIELGQPAPGLIQRIAVSALPPAAAPKLKAVGLGGAAAVRVTVARFGSKTVTVKVGAPLALSLSSEQLHAVLAYHFAVLETPNPRLAAAVVNRMADLGRRSAERGARMRDEVAPFLHELHSRAWARMEALCGAGVAHEAWRAWQETLGGFGQLETHLQAVMDAQRPFPKRFLNSWAASRYRAAVALDWLSERDDQMLSTDWRRGRRGAMRVRLAEE